MIPICPLRARSIRNAEYGRSHEYVGALAQSGAKGLRKMGGIV